MRDQEPSRRLRSDYGQCSQTELTCRAACEETGWTSPAGRAIADASAVRGEDLRKGLNPGAVAEAVEKALVVCPRKTESADIGDPNSRNDKAESLHVLLGELAIQQRGLKPSPPTAPGKARGAGRRSASGRRIVS